jgi:hypothetical protein
VTETQAVGEQEEFALKTVSRKDAKKYERYEAWYRNEGGLFGALQKFIAKGADPAFWDLAGLSRVEAGNLEGKAQLRSSVENLRNPVHRIVEFYATTMLSGPLDEALKVEAQDEPAGAEAGEPRGDASGETPARVPESRVPSGGDRAERLKDAIVRVWEWSNMGQRKQVGKRYLARDGQTFVKVVRPEAKPHCYEQFVPARLVTDFEADERGNLVYVRIDAPGTAKDAAGATRKVWNTEIWRKGKTDPKTGEKQAGYALFAETDRTSDASVPAEEVVDGSAGRNKRKVALGSDAPDAFAFDFVPFVVVNAQDTGDKRPEPVYAHGLHLISWVCREATRLSDLFFRFNKAFKVIGGIGNDPSGRPLPPPKPGNVRDLGNLHAEQQSASGAVGEHTVPFGGSRASLLNRVEEDISIEGVAVVGLPGNAQMFDATPNINYSAAREWISDHLREIYEELPELLYYAVESRANQSGAALRTLIAGALSRAEEMQANLIAGLVKADKMALTIAQLEGFEGFSAEEIGIYENGGFDHEIEPPEVLPLTEEETQRAEKGKIDNAQALVALLTQLGVAPEAQRKVVLAQLGHEDLIEEAGSATAPEGAPARGDLEASQQALAARLNGQQTPGSLGGDGGG